MRKSRGKVIDPGTVTGGVEVLSVECGGNVLAETRYRIRYQCCQGETVTTHAALTDRVRKNLKFCPKCASLQKRHSSSRETLVRSAEKLGLRVLAVEPGSRVRETRFLIVNPCCGKQQDLGITAMRLRVKTQVSKCRKCAAAENLLLAKDGRKKDDQSDPREITDGPLWPKPPSVPTGRWCWGAR